MKVVTFASFKGGAGKSTAAMVACSAWVSTGRTIAMIDADENAPLLRWRDAGRTCGTWDEACEVERGDDMASLEGAYSRAEASGRDVTVIDTRGGGSELNNACIGSADLVVVPTALTALDIAAALSTVEYAVRLLDDMRLATPLMLLIGRVPVGRLTVSQARDLDALSSLPRLDAVLHARDAFGAIGKRGMLHLTEAALAADRMQRLAASHVGTAMREARDLANEIGSKVEA